ncbi:MAG: hypothetical protein NXI01_04175 [Gammaproteobacteria bacterium]|nr:hypothetical protein [Gammaproteobacteria bacterium]
MLFRTESDPTRDQIVAYLSRMLSAIRVAQIDNVDQRFCLDVLADILQKTIDRSPMLFASINEGQKESIRDKMYHQPLLIHLNTPPSAKIVAQYIQDRASHRVIRGDDAEAIVLYQDVLYCYTASSTTLDPIDMSSENAIHLKTSMPPASRQGHFWEHADGKQRKLIEQVTGLAETRSRENDLDVIKRILYKKLSISENMVDLYRWSKVKLYRDTIGAVVTLVLGTGMTAGMMTFIKHLQGVLIPLAKFLILAKLIMVMAVALAVLGFSAALYHHFKQKTFEEFQTDLHAAVKCEKTYPAPSVTQRMQHNSIFEFFGTHSEELAAGFEQLNLAP